MKTFKEIYKEELDKLIEQMEKRHKVYTMLEDYKFKHGQIPEKFLPHWTAWITDGRQHWKRVHGVWEKVKKSARITARNRMKNEKTA